MLSEKVLNSLEGQIKTNVDLILYSVNQDLCDKLWGAIGLTGSIFCRATHLLWRVVYDLSDIEKKSGDIYNYEMDCSFVSSSTFAYS
jgi:hypothetical protein